MTTKQQLAKDLGLSRKTLYNYMNNLKITELTDNNIIKIKEYSKNKNKSKEITKADLLEELEELKRKNIELSKHNETLEESQKVLLNQIEWYKNSVDSEIRQIKENMILLLNPPKEEKKGFFSKLFK